MEWGSEQPRLHRESLSWKTKQQQNKTKTQTKNTSPSLWWRNIVSPTQRQISIRCRLLKLLEEGLPIPWSVCRQTFQSTVMQIVCTWFLGFSFVSSLQQLVQSHQPLTSLYHTQSALLCWDLCSGFWGGHSHPLAVLGFLGPDACQSVYSYFFPAVRGTNFLTDNKTEPLTSCLSTTMASNLGLSYLNS